MTDLQYMARERRHAQHAEAVAAAIRQSLEAAGYRVGGQGLVVAPCKVCKLLSELGVRLTALLDEAGPSEVVG